MSHPADALGRAYELARAEACRAQIKHNYSVENRTNDGRLRILTEEVGEVARAIEDIENAIEDRRNISLVGTTEQLENAREVVRLRMADLRDELVQVAATALRWVARMEQP